MKNVSELKDEKKQMDLLPCLKFWKWNVMKCELEKTPLLCAMATTESDTCDILSKKKTSITESPVPRCEVTPKHADLTNVAFHRFLLFEYTIPMC